MSLAILIFACVIFITIGGKFVVKKMLKDEHVIDHQNMIEAMLGVVGTLFALLLGLLVASAIDNYRDIKDQVSQEANGVADVFRIARGFSEVDRKRIRTICRRYVDVVITQEWPEMEQQKMNAQAWSVYQELWEATIAASPENDRQNNLQQSLLSSMQSIGENRRSRAIAVENSMPVALWITIVSGSLITIVFTFLLTTKIGLIPNVMTGLIALSLGLNIWLLAQYSTPFQGALHLSSQPFNLLKQQTLTQPDTPSRYLTETKSPSGLKVNMEAPQASSTQALRTKH